MIAIYVIKCVDSTYYTGITKCIKTRWSQHLAGKCRYTRKHIAKEIVFVDYAPDYSQARVIEKYIKKTGAKRFLFSKGIFI